jgi:GMP synthase PP-ATPase subunit
MIRLAISKRAVSIKNHHNVWGLPEQLGLKLLEPVRDLFKDEVRGINRVTFDVSSKPPATIEWE